jgi:hypothetical protein
MRWNDGYFEMLRQAAAEARPTTAKVTHLCSLRAVIFDNPRGQKTKGG